MAIIQKISKKRMSGITYEEAIKYLYHSYAKGIRVGQKGVKEILACMGSPYNKLPVIHVAGTNGKGSTCTFLQNILMAAGFKVGIFTSPHLKRYNERIAVEGEISDQDFARYLTSVAQSARERPSFFEALTCMAYSYFTDCAVDIAIMETGIGGRLDSTNIVDSPLLSVITAPGYDHQELLGDTLTQIAMEDSGIIKEGSPVALYPVGNECAPVLSVIEEAARAKNSPLYYIGTNAEITNLKYSLSGTEFSVKTAYFSYQSLSIQLLGAHQLQNAIHSLLCVEALRKNYNIPHDAVRRGLAECTWPGRFQLVSQNPCVVLDGAHNVDGARIFKEALELYFPNRHIVLVVGISRHKDYRSILFHLLAVVDTVICTCSRFKAIPAAELAKEIKLPTFIEEDCSKALDMAVDMAGPDGVVAVAGSLYLIGDLV